jgi:hypothetical protein
MMRTGAIESACKKSIGYTLDHFSAAFRDRGVLKGSLTAVYSGSRLLIEGHAILQTIVNMFRRSDLVD